MLYMLITEGIFYWILFLYPFSILMSEWVFLGRQNKRSYYIFRYIIAILIMEAAIFLIPTISTNLIYDIFYFCLIYIGSVFTMWFVYDLKFNAILFYCTAGLAVHYLLQSFLALCFCSVQILGNIKLQLIHHAIVSTCYVFLFIILGDRFVANPSDNINNHIIIVTSLICMCIIVVLEKSFDVLQKEIGEQIIIRIYEMISAAFVLVLQFFTVTKNRLVQDMEKINDMWEYDKKRMEISRQIVDLINIKHHDMKFVKNNQESEARNEDYFPLISTGRKALDAVITEHILYANANGIKFSYYCEESIDKLTDIEIYSLFGNLLSNAMEAVLKLEDEEQRIVNLYINKRKEHFYIDVYNYFEGNVHFEHGLPQTSKQDKNGHGYGVKSVKMITERYGGSVIFETQNKFFSVEVII